MKFSLFFEAILRVAMKKKVPKAAAVAPWPHEKQHAASACYKDSFRERCPIALHTCCRQ